MNLLWTSHVIREGFLKDFLGFLIQLLICKKKGIKFEWSPKCQASFDTLKQLLKIAPILKLAYPNKEYVVC